MRLVECSRVAENTYVAKNHRCPSDILLFVSGLLADQTTRFPNEVAESALEQLERKMDWLYFPTGLLKSSSARGGAKYSMLPFKSWKTQLNINDNNIIRLYLDTIVSATTGGAKYSMYHSYPAIHNYFNVPYYLVKYNTNTTTNTLISDIIQIIHS